MQRLFTFVSALLLGAGILPGQASGQAVLQLHGGVGFEDAYSTTWGLSLGAIMGQALAGRDAWIAARFNRQEGFEGQPMPEALSLNSGLGNLSQIQAMVEVGVNVFQTDALALRLLGEVGNSYVATREGYRPMRYYRFAYSPGVALQTTIRRNYLAGVEGRYHHVANLPSSMGVYLTLGRYLGR